MLLLTYHNTQIFISPLHCSYTATASRLECVTAPYPGAVEGESYPRLQSRVLTSGGGSFTSTNADESFTYDWNYTPQVRIVLGSVGGGGGGGVLTDSETNAWIRVGACMLA